MEEVSGTDATITKSNVMYILMSLPLQFESLSRQSVPVPLQQNEAEQICDLTKSS